MKSFFGAAHQLLASKVARALPQQIGRPLSTVGTERTCSRIPNATTIFLLSQRVQYFRSRFSLDSGIMFRSFTTLLPSFELLRHKSVSLARVQSHPSPYKIESSEINANALCNPHMLQALRGMNRNARRPKKANRGKRPVCNQRRRAKNNQLRSRAYKKKIFGFW